MEIHLKTQKKILIHLYDYRKYEDRYEYPPEITQQGIGKVVGISVSHVPRNISKLINEGLVVAKKGHVPSKKKRVTVYFLTEKGISETKKIIDELKDMDLEIEGEKYKIKELKKSLRISYIELIKRIEKKNIKIEDLKNRRKVIFKEVNITSGIFVNRIEELRIMKNWYAHGKVLVIIGSKGYGKSALIEKFIEREKPKENIVWLQIYGGRKWSNIEETFKNMFNSNDILHILRTEPTILIFDNYFDVDDLFVENLVSFVNEDLGRSKVIVSMRPDTPFYNRFYTLSDVIEGKVMEIKLGGLSYENSKLILPEVKDFAFRRIYQLTKGNPWILNLLRTGEIDKTKGLPLTPENIHLLKYLASQKKE